MQQIRNALSTIGMLLVLALLVCGTLLAQK